MKNPSTNSRSIYLMGIVLPLAVIVLLLVLVANQPTKPALGTSAQNPQSYLAVASPVGTQPVLPTLPPVPAVPSVGPSAIVPVHPTMGQPTAGPTGSSQSPQNPVQLLRQETFGSWSYVARRVGNEQPSASVRVNAKSVESLQAFIGVNKQYADQLAADGGTAIVRVVFRQTLDPDTYRSWARGSGITQFDIVCLPGVDLSGGPTGALCVYPGSSDPLPEAAFAQAKKGVRTVQGVYFVKGIIAANLLPTLVTDPQVLIADLTDNMVQRDLSAAGISGATNVVVSNDMPIFKVMDLLSHSK